MQSTLTQAAATPRARLLHVIIVVAGSLALAASARISAPMVPVPTTMQTYALLVLAALFGPRLAAAMTVAYLVEGFSGLPFFAGGAGGPHVLLGPTAGYLYAFPLAAALVGYVHTRRPGLVVSLATMVAAHAFIIAIGVAWLALQIGPRQAVLAGAAPFVVGSLVKAVLAAVTVVLARRSRS